MNNYYRIMLGRKSAHAAECFAGGFVGGDDALRDGAHNVDSEAEPEGADPLAPIGLQRSVH